MKSITIVAVLLGLAIAAVAQPAGNKTAVKPVAAADKCVSIDEYFKTTGKSLIAGVAMADLLKGQKVKSATLFIPSNSKLFDALPSVLPLLGKVSIADAIKNPSSVLALKMFQDVLKQHIVLGANLDPTTLPATAFKANRATVGSPTLLTTDIATATLCKKGTTQGGVTVEVLGKSIADPAKKINILAQGTAASLNQTLADAPCGVTIHIINGVLLPCRGADFTNSPIKAAGNTTTTTTRGTTTTGTGTSTTAGTPPTSGTPGLASSGGSTTGAPSNSTGGKNSAVTSTGSIATGLIAAIAATFAAML